MKKTLVIVLLLAISVAANAQTWHTANQSTIAWDAVSTLFDGSPIPSGSTIEYEVYLANAITDPQKSHPVLAGTTTEPTYLITLNVEGKFLFGVKANRLVGAETVSESAVSWSDV